MKANKHNSYLSSTIPLKARLLTDIPTAKERLSAYPNMKILKKSRFPKYLIKSDTSDLFYTLELGSNSLSFTTFSLSSPLYELKNSFIRLISIAAILSEDYSIEINAVFPYLLHLLAKIEVKQQEKITPGRDTELILSRRIINLLQENKKLAIEGTKANQDLMRISTDLILAKYGSNSNIKEITSRTGLEESTVRMALGAIQGRGNRLIYNSKGNFDIVKT